MKYAIILASGTGTRFQSALPKQFIKIAGKSILEHTIEAFENSSLIDKILIVITPQYRYILEEILIRNSYKKIHAVLNGGETRKESSYIGISAIEDDNSHVLIHDCVRPFVSEKILADCIEALKKYDAVDVAIASPDTLIKINDNHEIDEIPNRNLFRKGQTPQAFKVSVIKKAHELSKDDENFTDDCGLIIKHKLCPVYIVEGENKNIKITLPEDIFLADKLFQINTISIQNNYDYKNLEKKVLVVFGGHSGIGKSIVELTQKYNACVYAFSLRDNVDISNYEQVAKKLKEVAEKEGKIDYVVNTAGSLVMGKLLDRDIEDIYQEIATNYMGSINISKASIPYLAETRGCILLFASSSYTRGRALYSIYSSTKAGIVNLTQALAEELFNENIRINVITPKRTATPMRFKNFGKEPAESLLSPEEVAEISVNTLLSDYTGQVVGL